MAKGLSIRGTGQRELVWESCAWPMGSRMGGIVYQGEEYADEEDRCWRAGTIAPHAKSIPDGFMKLRDGILRREPNTVTHVLSEGVRYSTK